MLVYQATKREFMDDVEADAIADAITAAFERKLHRANPAEVTSWRNSMEYMYKVLNTSALPDGCGVAIEFSVPYTSSRIDFLLTGRQDGARDAAVIVELKQWQSLEAVPGKDGVVRTFRHQPCQAAPAPRLCPPNPPPLSRFPPLPLSTDP
ncbi:MAG: hypothetical protein RBS17_10285 [Coriobacteriia bacterium]|nr:hypothetical protein [Coriobacteriia bacterium]